MTGVVAGGIVLATRDSPTAARPGAGRDDRLERRRRRRSRITGPQPATSAVVYQQILPSIVAIETKSASTKGDGEGLGTGVIVNANGTILTAFHVVDGATRIRVTFVDGTRSRAEVASTDPENDIAVLVPKRRPEVIVPAVLGGGVQVGDETYAVGHPLGYVDSLTVRRHLRPRPLGRRRTTARRCAA